MEIIAGRTNRGFMRLDFTDRYLQECSLQESSLANEAAIWFGVDNTGPEIKGPSGWPNEKVGARMHLTQSQVRALLPALVEFAEIGNITTVRPEWKTRKD